MMEDDPLDVILAEVHSGLRPGFRASRLMYRRRLLDMLVPSEEPRGSASHSDLLARATTAEKMLITACEQCGSEAGDALKALLGLSGNHAAPLYQRRKVACAFLGVRPRTFTKNYESDLLMDLAAEIWKLISLT